MNARKAPRNIRMIVTVMVAAIYALLYSSGLIWQDPQQRHDTILVIETLIVAVGVIWSLFYCLSFSRLLIYVCVPFLCLTGAIASYFVYTFNATINDAVVPLLFETNLQEARGVINEWFFLWTVGSLIVSLIMIGMIRNCASHRDDTKIFVLACLIMTGALIGGNNLTIGVIPFNYLNISANYVAERFNITSTSTMVIPPVTLSNPLNDDLTAVFVIGESARSDHFGLNDYPRDTTPLLEDIDNLANFSQTTSCEVLTRLSVPCMMTRATASNPRQARKEVPFSAIFKRLGFYTAWINGQSASINVFVDPSITRIAYQTDNYLAGGNFKTDEDLIPVIRMMLEEHPKKLLLIIHMVGSHWPYGARYSDRFNTWQPTCASDYDFLGRQIMQMKACDPQALINDYDNTILHTDYVLSTIISLLKDRNSLLAYSSDHGESLGENGQYLHGQTEDRHIKEQRQVPMIWWVSDRYIKANPERYEALLDKMEDAVSHDHIFHSMLDCAGIDSEIVDKNLSLCR